MEYKLVKLSRFSGEKASIYSVQTKNTNDEFQDTLFDEFVKENKNSLLSELKDLFTRLKTIGNNTGARESFFKINEGVPGDGVCALYDNPKKRLRLYCIRYGTDLIILGGGGIKNVQKLQDDKKLKDENYLLRRLSFKITECLKNGEITFSHNFLDLEGNLIIEDYEK